jgi:hypothetical protein
MQLNELNNNFRVIPIDGRLHPKDSDPTFNGHPDQVTIDGPNVLTKTWISAQRTGRSDMRFWMSINERTIKKKRHRKL